MTGTLQTKGSKFYAVLNFKNESGQRVQKWINLLRRFKKADG